MGAPIFRSWAGVALLLLACGAARGQANASSVLAKDTDAIVANYRKIIVLMNGAGALDPGVKERASTAGKILFQQNEEKLAALEALLTKGLVDGQTAPAEEFLGRVEAHAEYRDADKLAFRDLLEGLAAAPETAANAKLQGRIRDDLAALAQIRALYQKEIGEILGNLQTRGMVVHR